jgi:type I restriction enzyme R subunit
MLDVGSLPSESVAIQEHLRDVELARSSKLWDRVGIDPIDFLRTKIAPLMRYTQNVEPNEASFTQKCEELSLAILTGNQCEIERLKEAIAAMLNCLPLTIREVKEKETELDRVLKESFWQKLTYDDAQTLIEIFAPLMKYKRSEPRPPIVLDIDDVMEKIEIIEYGPTVSPKTAYVQDYRDRIERRIRNLAAGHPTIVKIERGEAITEEDLQKLEQTLNSPDLYITEEILQKVYKQQRGTLVDFVKKILGLYEFPEPEKKIEEAFKTFMIEKNYLNADQVNFLRTIQTVFAKKKHIGFSDLYEPPFTNFGPKAPLPLFGKDELEEVMKMCKNLEVEVFQHV